MRSRHAFPITLPRMILVSGLLHLALALGATFLSFPGKAMSIYRPQYHVRLVGPEALPPGGPKSAEEAGARPAPSPPPPPQQKTVAQPPKEEKKTAPPVVQEKKEEKAKPVPVATPKPQEKPVATTPTKPTPTTTQRAERSPADSKKVDSLEEAVRRIQQDVAQRKLMASAGGAGGAGGSSRGGGGGLTGGMGSLEYNAYYDQISRKIWENWIPPQTYDPKSERYKTIVRIKILPDGTIEQNFIEKSSGNRLFDESVMRAILKSNPLPAPPSGFASSGLEIGFIFDSSQRDAATHY